MYHWPWDECYDRCLELLGALQSSAEAEAILGPSGPQLAAQDLHPWVWHAAVDLWDAKHLRPAVLDAHVKVELLTQSKVERTDISGKALWGEIFSVDPPQVGRPRLRFVGVVGQSERYVSAHEGAMHLGMACAQGIRNWAAHTDEDADEQMALEYLAAISVLARWVDGCELDTAS